MRGCVHGGSRYRCRSQLLQIYPCSDPWRLPSGDLQQGCIIGRLHGPSFHFSSSSCMPCWFATADGCCSGSVHYCHQLQCARLKPSLLLSSHHWKCSYYCSNSNCSGGSSCCTCFGIVLSRSVIDAVDAFAWFTWLAATSRSPCRWRNCLSLFGVQMLLDDLESSRAKTRPFSLQYHHCKTTTHCSGSVDKFDCNPLGSSMRARSCWYEPYTRRCLDVRSEFFARSSCHQFSCWNCAADASTDSEDSTHASHMHLQLMMTYLL